MPLSLRRLCSRSTLPLLLAALGLPSASPAQTLRGSQESVDATYEYAQQRRLTFHQTARTVRRAAAHGAFVRLTGNADYRVKGVTFPYVLPATRTFVHRLSSEYRAVCREQLTITSAVRPSSRQPRNAVAKSVHPTGLAVDVRKPKGRACRDWLRERLLELEADGAVDATEEYRPPHFHLVVYAVQERRAPLSSASSTDLQRR